jgi:hypothetical protein
MKQPSNYQDEVKRVADRIDDALIHAVHRMDENDDIDLDNIIISLAEARAYIVGLSIRLIAVDRLLISIPGDGPRIYADELPPGDKPKPLELPKLKPLPRANGKPRYKLGITKLLKGPKDFVCPTCRAEQDTNCFRFTGPGHKGEITDVRNDGSFFHIERAKLSRAANDRIRKANVMR